MNEEVKKMILSIGVIAEALSIMRDNLVKNGFTREEAIRLCGDFLRAMMGGGKDG